jgi:hypothetical protein
MSWARRLGVGLIALGVGQASWARDPFGPRVELKVPGRVIDARPADLDGDGQMEILVFWRQGEPPDTQGRVSVYRAPGGVPGPRPAQVLGLPAAMVAFDLGDVNLDGRADLVWLQGDGVWAFPGLADGRLAEVPVPIIQTALLSAFPHPDHVPPMSLLLDLGPPGRSRPAMLLPVLPAGPLALYEPNPDGRWTRRELLRAPVRANLHTSAEDTHAVREYGAVLQFSLPRLVVADQDGDGQPDLLFFADDAVAVFRARPDGTFPREPDVWRSFGLLTAEERVQRGVFLRGDAADLDGDGRADLLFNKTRGGLASMRALTRVYRAGPDGAYPPRPSLEIDTPGFGSSLKLLDADGDGRVDLVRPHLEMGLMAMSRVLLSSRMDIDFLLHLSSKAGRGALPGPRPDCAVSGSFSLDFQSSQEMSGPYPVLGHDFTGDGRPDVVVGLAGGGSGKTPDRLELRAGSPAGCFETGAVWRVELEATRYVSAYRPRADGRPGLIVRFSRGEALRGDVWVFPPRPE